MSSKLKLAEEIASIEKDIQNAKEEIYSKITDKILNTSLEDISGTYYNREQLLYYFKEDFPLKSYTIEEVKGTLFEKLNIEDTYGFVNGCSIKYEGGFFNKGFSSENYISFNIRNKNGFFNFSTSGVYTEVVLDRVNGKDKIVLGLDFTKNEELQTKLKEISDHLKMKEERTLLLNEKDRLKRFKDSLELFL